jgi:cation:H+ antiporter
MINSIFIFIVAMFLVIRGATLATKYAVRLAKSYRLSKYTVGFIIIAVISILPETFIAINSSIKGLPSFGLGMLFGSNIADLTLIIAIIIFFARRGLKVENKILKNSAVYPLLLLLPLLLGIDGYYSRLEGIVLIISGGVFYYIALKSGIDGTVPQTTHGGKSKNFLMLIFSMFILLVGSHFVVSSTSGLANFLGISPILVGMLIVGLGTTMPELLFSLKSVEKRDDSLAIGDVLGTVLADATIVVGILALVNPFSFPQKVIYITGTFMVAASIILFYFMRSGRIISRKEGYMLFAFWLIFVIAEFIANY